MANQEFEYQCFGNATEAARWVIDDNPHLILESLSIWLQNLERAKLGQIQPIVTDERIIKAKDVEEIWQAIVLLMKAFLKEPDQWIGNNQIKNQIAQLELPNQPVFISLLEILIENALTINQIKNLITKNTKHLQDARRLFPDKSSPAVIELKRRIVQKLLILRQQLNAKTLQQKNNFQEIYDFLIQN